MQKIKNIFWNWSIWEEVTLAVEYKVAALYIELLTRTSASRAYRSVSGAGPVYILYTNEMINYTFFQYAVQNTENYETHNTEEKDKTM